MGNNEVLASKKGNEKIATKRQIKERNKKKREGKTSHIKFMHFQGRGDKRKPPAKTFRKVQRTLNRIVHVSFSQLFINIKYNMCIILRK